jgi:hypothetical protein
MLYQLPKIAILLLKNLIFFFSTGYCITARVRRIIVNDKLVWKERSSNGLENLGICMDGLLATVRNPAGYSIYGLNLKLQPPE